LRLFWLVCFVFSLLAWDHFFHWIFTFFKKCC
jgi:hypothetical protein